MNKAIALIPILLSFLLLFYFQEDISRLQDEYHTLSSIFEPVDRQYYFINRHGYYIYFNQWNTREKPKAVIFMMHDLGEHSNTWNMHSLGKALRRNGYHVYAIDMQGHGFSNGERGFFNSLDDISNDLHGVMGTILAKYDDYTPFLLYGHGVGALSITQIAMVLKYGFEGVILSNLNLMPRFDSSSEFWYHQISNYLPKYKMPGSSLDFTSVTTNQTAQTKVNNDPLLYREQFPTRVLMSIESIKKELREGIQAITWPTLLIHGTGSFWEKESSQLYYDLISSKDKELKFFDNSHHMYIDNTGEQVIDTVIQWLDNHYDAGHIKLEFLFDGGDMQPY